MIMIHEKSYSQKALVLRNAADLVTRAISDLPTLLESCLTNNAKESSSYHAIFLFTKIAQCGAFTKSDNERLVAMYLQLIAKINTHLSSGQEWIATADFAEDSYISEKNLYAFDTEIVRKHAIESRTILEKQRFSLLKSEMLILVSSDSLSST